MNKRLRQELCKMRDDDQAMRNSSSWDDSIDKKHTERLKEIISEYGWLDESLVSEDGSQAAWLIAQHADHDVKFQEHALSSLKASKNPSKRNIAFLTDRILVNKNQSQVFGTQFYKNDKGQMIPQPIKEPEDLASRRKEYELEPFEEYKKLIQEIQARRDG